MASLLGATESLGVDTHRLVQVNDIDGNQVTLRFGDPVLSAAETASPNVIDIGSLTIDVPAREVTAEGSPVHLTRREFDLLVFLVQNPRRVFSKAQLLQSVWCSDAAWQSEATVTEHIRRLRRKLGYAKSTPCGLTTVWGVGYRFVP